MDEQQQRRRMASGSAYPPLTRKASQTYVGSGGESLRRSAAAASMSSNTPGRISRPQSRQGSKNTASAGDGAAWTGPSTSYAISNQVSVQQQQQQQQRQRYEITPAAPPLRSATSTPVSAVSSVGEAASQDGEFGGGSSSPAYQSPRKARARVADMNNATGARDAYGRERENDTLRPQAARTNNGRTVSSSSVASSSSTGPQIAQSAPVLIAPASPTKERIRMAGIRSAGVGGSHFKQKGDEESKIQVSVRIRGLAPGETAPPRPALGTDGPHCFSVRVLPEQGGSVAGSGNGNVAVNSVQSALVGEAGPSRAEKVYPFDHVFGPEADQGMIYQAAVGPVLNEVLSGYNCTVFAYGQTGTGKTHTMEGDLTSSVGTYSPEAGIIPRTLYRLFHTLESMRAEYSVHASFVELYNEELRDLLSDEAPQPLGGSGSTGLRMYEDSKIRGGVIIQGLEDVAMKDAEHGLKLLRKGSQKRQIAATRCNESSSRSHSVFTLTVYIKETTAKGEDVLRTGKLNLVDLAGSENIGRSGAESKRAREAGMINQSLLTLGRVINALVEKASHVPYRESKLTRLLQDSLGGRTKTCIIATVSPDRRNLEETLSTLDYALRAKSIRNKPEVNQRMTRAALIKEYVVEIERLKGDLLASREKNGIYLSPESWTTMQDEQETAQTQIDDLRRQSEVTESKMASLREQFEQNMQMLVKREAEAKAVRAECKDKEDELSTILCQFNELREAATEEKALRKAYFKSERRLHAIASNMKSVVKDSTKDVDGLFAKLDRRTKIEKSNRDIVAECQASLLSMSNQLEARVSDFGSTHEQFTMDLSAQITEFCHREQDKLRSSRQCIDNKLKELQTLAKAADKDAALKRQEIDILADAIRREGDILVEASSKRNEELQSASSQLVESVVADHRESLEGVRQGIDELGDMLFSVLRELKDQASRDAKTLESAKTLANKSMQSELQRLRQQSSQLAAALADERVKTATMRDTLCKNIGQLVLNFCQEQDHGVSSIIDGFASSNVTAIEELQSFHKVHDAKMEELLSCNTDARESLKNHERAARVQRARAEASLDESTATVERQMNGFTSKHFKSDREGLELVGATLHNISSHVHKIRDSSIQAGQNSERSLARYRAGAEKGLSDAGAEIQSTLEDVEETCEGVAEAVKEHSTFGNQFLYDTNEQLGTLRSTARDYLSTRLQIDQPTGTTPHKKEWPPLATWTLVQGDESGFSTEGDSVSAANGGDNSILSARQVYAQQLAPPVPIMPDSRAAANPSWRASDDENAQPPAVSARVRPSLPAIGRKSAKNGPSKAYPLGERTRNRLSMAAPSSARAHAPTAKTRALGTSYRSGSVDGKSA